MEEDTSNISGELVRRTGLLFLPNIGTNLRDFFANIELPEEDWESVCAEHIALCCISCGKVVEGSGLAAWLLAIGAGESRPSGGLDFVRLRSGCCASTSCNGRFYNVVFKPHADIDWHGLSTSVLEDKEEETAPSMVGIASDAAKESVAKQITKKSAILLGVLLALWLFKHWYTGGEIPIIQPAQELHRGIPRRFRPATRAGQLAGSNLRSTSCTISAGMGLTKRFITEMFGSTGDRESKSLVRGMAKFLRWGAVSISLLFVMGYMGYEVAMTTGLIAGGENSATPQNPSDLPTANELISEHGDKLDRALANGSIDRVLNERGVPKEMRETIKEQIRKRNAPTTKQ